MKTWQYQLTKLTGKRKKNEKHETEYPKTVRQLQNVNIHVLGIPQEKQRKRRNI